MPLSIHLFIDKIETITKKSVGLNALIETLFCIKYQLNKCNKPNDELHLNVNIWQLSGQHFVRFPRTQEIHSHIPHTHTDTKWIVCIPICFSLSFWIFSLSIDTIFHLSWTMRMEMKTTNIDSSLCMNHEAQRNHI